MDEEERDREARIVGRNLISDAQFNNILEKLTDNYFAYCLEYNPAEFPTTLFCYEATYTQGVFKRTEELRIGGGISPEQLNRVGKKLFNMGVKPVAVFLIGFGDFMIKEGGKEDRKRPGLIIGAITLDSRSAHAEVELAHGDTKLIPINKFVFPYVDSKTRKYYNQLVHVYEGYSEFMKLNEVSNALAEGFASIGMWGEGNH